MLSPFTGFGCADMFIRADRHVRVLSYPRTETERFTRSHDLLGLIEQQRDSPLWGQFAASLVEGVYICCSFACGLTVLVGNCVAVCTSENYACLVALVFALQVALNGLAMGLMTMP